MSEDKTRLLYLDFFEFEVIGNVFSYDINTKQEKAITQYDYGDDVTAKFVEWVDNETIAYISGLAYGTVTRGGDIHILMSDGSVKSIHAKGQDEEYTSFKVREQKLIAKKIIWDKERMNYKEFVEIIELGEL